MSRISLLFFSSFTLLLSVTVMSLIRRLAPVTVFVTDLKDKPSKGEQVHFKTENTKDIEWPF